EPELPVIVVNPPLFYAILPNTLSNGMKGESYGATMMVNWRPVADWRLQFDYTYFDLQLHNKPGSLNADGQNIEGNSPEHQFSVHSFLDLPHDLHLYMGLRVVDKLPNQGVGSYAALDVSLG